MKILAPLDLAKNELQNAVLHVLASAPGTPAAGQVYYNSTTGIAYYRDGVGSAWVAIGGGGGGDADTLNGEDETFYLDRTNHTGSQAASTISDLATTVQAYTLDVFAAPAANVSLNSHKITNLANGTANGDAVNYGQLLGIANGTKWKAPVRVKATGNLTLSGTYTHDGVAIQAGDRVAAFSQSTSSQDGVYVAAAGAWARADDFPSGGDASNAAFFVQEGTAGADTQWTVTNNSGSAVIGTDNLALTQIGAATSYSADGSTLTLSGATFSINTGYTGQASITTLGTIATGVWQGTAVGVSYGGTGATSAAAARSNLGAVGKYSATIGDGSSTSIAITQGTHGLAANGQMVVQAFDASTGAMVLPDVSINNSNGTVTFSFGTAPSSNSIRIVLMG